jgi:hypothetical protein
MYGRGGGRGFCWHEVCWGRSPPPHSASPPTDVQVGAPKAPKAPCHIAAKLQLLLVWSVGKGH